MQTWNQPEVLDAPKIGEEEILRGVSGLVFWLCRSYRKREDYEDLLQVARIGALNGIRRHDPSRGPLVQAIALGMKAEISRYFKKDRCIKRACPGRIVSLDEPLNEDEDFILADIVEDPRENVEEKVIADILSAEALEAVNNPRARNVLEMRLGGYTLREIGAAYGLSHERIRQIEAKALKIMRGNYESTN